MYLRLKAFFAKLCLNILAFVILGLQYDGLFTVWGLASSLVLLASFYSGIQQLRNGQNSEEDTHTQSLLPTHIHLHPHTHKTNTVILHKKFLAYAYEGKNLKSLIDFTKVF